MLLGCWAKEALGYGAGLSQCLTTQCDAVAFNISIGSANEHVVRDCQDNAKQCGKQITFHDQLSLGLQWPHQSVLVTTGQRLVASGGWEQQRRIEGWDAGLS